MTQFSLEIFTKKFFFLFGLGPSLPRQKGVAGGAEGVLACVYYLYEGEPKRFHLEWMGLFFFSSNGYLLTPAIHQAFNQFSVTMLIVTDPVQRDGHVSWGYPTPLKSSNPSFNL